jgi:thioredoxin 1
MENLTKETFIEKIFDYENEREWKFKGDKPAIIDFYADWCGPCKMVAPILEELSLKYEGVVDVYKIDTEEQYEIAGKFGIRSIPSILFIPMGEQPEMISGALPKSSFEEGIKSIFGVKPLPKPRIEIEDEDEDEVE